MSINTSLEVTFAGINHLSILEKIGSPTSTYGINTFVAEDISQPGPGLAANRGPGSMTSFGAHNIRFIRVILQNPGSTASRLTPPAWAKTPP